MYVRLGNLPAQLTGWERRSCENIWRFSAYCSFYIRKCPWFMQVSVSFYQVFHIKTNTYVSYSLNFDFLCPSSDVVSCARAQPGGSWGAHDPPLCEPFCKQTTYNIEVTIWWEPYVWLSVTPPLKNPGYAHVIMTNCVDRRPKPNLPSFLYELFKAQGIQTGWPHWVVVFENILGIFLVETHCVVILLVSCHCFFSFLQIMSSSHFQVLYPLLFFM